MSTDDKPKKIEINNYKVAYIAMVATIIGVFLMIFFEFTETNSLKHNFQNFILDIFFNYKHLNYFFLILSILSVFILIYFLVFLKQNAKNEKYSLLKYSVTQKGKKLLIRLNIFLILIFVFSSFYFAPKMFVKIDISNCKDKLCQAAIKKFAKKARKELKLNVNGLDGTEDIILSPYIDTIKNPTDWIIEAKINDPKYELFHYQGMRNKQKLDIIGESDYNVIIINDFNSDVLIPIELLTQVVELKRDSNLNSKNEKIKELEENTNNYLSDCKAYGLFDFELKYLLSDLEIEKLKPIIEEKGLETESKFMHIKSSSKKALELLLDNQIDDFRERKFAYSSIMYSSIIRFSYSDSNCDNISDSGLVEIQRVNFLKDNINIHQLNDALASSNSENIEFLKNNFSDCLEE